MSLNLDYQHDADQVEQELIRYAVAIGFDWKDKTQATLLAQEFREFNEQKALEYQHSGDLNLKNKIKFFGLAQIMLTVMATGAKEEMVHIHGGECWKSFARALYALGS